MHLQLLDDLLDLFGQHSFEISGGESIFAANDLFGTTAHASSPVETCVVINHRVSPLFHAWYGLNSYASASAGDPCRSLDGWDQWRSSGW
jgi:hypothetical protein